MARTFLTSNHYLGMMFLNDHASNIQGTPSHMECNLPLSMLPSQKLTSTLQPTQTVITDLVVVFSAKIKLTKVFKES